MNNLQCKAIAAGFIFALEESRELRDRWVDIRKAKEWKKLRALIGQTLGTAEEPTAEDLEEMRKYCNKRLKPEVSELKQLDHRIEPEYVYNGMPHGGRGGGKDGR